MRSFDELYQKDTDKDEVSVDDDGKLKFYEKDPIKQFLICIADGATFDNACGYAKLLPKRVKEWIAKGEEDAENDKDSSSYADFYFRYKKAQAVFELNMIKSLDTAIANGDATKAMWRLERRMAEYYSQKQEIKATDAQIIIKNDVAKA